MMMPRAYHYGSGNTRERSLSPKTRTSPSPTRPRTIRYQEDKFVENEKEREMGRRKQSNERSGRSVSSGKPRRISSISHSSPSQPVVIPTKTATPKARRGSGGSLLQHDALDQHDPEAMSPSMAALLAVTSVPRTTARAIKGDHRRRLLGDEFRKSVSSTSPRSWNILQSPPSPTDTDNEQDKDTDVEFDLGSITSQSTLADRLAMYRSLSSDSIPSLDIEHDTFASPDSPPQPRTPSSRRARSPRRETKYPSLSEPLGAGEVHPLSMQHSIEDEGEEGDSEDSSENSSQIELDVSKTRKSSNSSKASSNFKSNLTASLQRLKSAARSLSIPTPSMTTVLAINSKFIVDNRPDSPRPKSPLPLTNSAFSFTTLATISREEGSGKSPLAQQLYFSSTPGEEYRPIASSIQLQGYVRRVPDENPLLDRASAPPIFASSTPPPPILLPGIDSPRPREPRENSDFLRVVVLEMNMRRAGKLGDVSGRARIWVGPRPEKVAAKPSNGTDSSSSTSTTASSTSTTAGSGKGSSAMTRAEKGMGEEVVTELAEAMNGGDEGDAEREGEGEVNRTAKTNSELASSIDEKRSSKGQFWRRKTAVPSRWTAWSLA